jgi:UDP-N-acetylmuramate dehydrogenase
VQAPHSEYTGGLYDRLFLFLIYYRRVPLDIQENVPLAPLTTLGVGGPARFFAECRSEEQVRAAVAWAQERQQRLFVLGGGSNLLVSDRGFPGLVLKISNSGILPCFDGIFVASAGTEWDSFVRVAVSYGFAGIECLSGIPGNVGGTPVQNVGAYGQEVSETILEVKAMELRSGAIRVFSNAECEFAYRESIFNTRERGRWIILEVRFGLRPGGQPKIAYRDLREYFAARSIASPSLQEVREAVREIRHRKAMLIVPGDDDARSAGSFFKNPVLAPEDYRRLVEAAAEREESVPSYPAADHSYKVPAAWLVEHAGFAKGYRRGPVGISSKHALAIVNLGNARAADVVALKDDIQLAVRDTFGIELHPEPVMVGFDEP